MFFTCGCLSWLSISLNTKAPWFTVKIHCFQLINIDNTERKLYLNLRFWKDKKTNRSFFFMGHTITTPKKLNFQKSKKYEILLYYTKVFHYWNFSAARLSLPINSLSKNSPPRFFYIFQHTRTMKRKTRQEGGNDMLINRVWIIKRKTHFKTWTRWLDSSSGS